MPYKDKQKQAEYQRQWMAKRRAEWLDKNGPCAWCGSWERLEVDHIDPQKKVHHAVWSWSEVRRAEELAKCRVLCSDCHKKRSAEWARSRMKHGTESMYRRAGCRCDACKVAKSVHNATSRRYDPELQRQVGRVAYEEKYGD